ncbi:hypothetical protein VTK73DRAFT_5097 [Phialemonium thermophilum]|uniref:GCS light chain n=1 Tax=Phialemonium thermophilum TaxID=223376 RepID=A0ABR3WPR7_9PEZI
MSKLILSTGNIVSDGPSIVRKPGSYRSNLELTHSLRSNLLAAQQDAAVAISNPSRNGHENGNGNTNLSSSGNGTGTPLENPPPLSLWTAQEGDVLYIPKIDWNAGGLQEEPSRYEITVKLFFLAGPPVHERAQYAKEALDLTLKELRVPSVDLLIVSYPGMSFDGDCEWAADKKNAEQGNDEEEFATWATAIEPLHRHGLVRQLGIAEYGSEKLSRLLQHAHIKPSVDQINIRNCCNVPPPLAKLAKEQNIELLVHSDCTDILPKGTLRQLLGQDPHGARVLADADCPEGGLRGDLTPQWVVKYTAVVRDRGVIENKGYFASAVLKQD